MDGSVPPLQIAHLVLAGIVIAVCIELILRCLFVPLGSQKSWLIRILKIIMAVFMTIKSAIFSAFSSEYVDLFIINVTQCTKCNYYYIQLSSGPL